MLPVLIGSVGLAVDTGVWYADMRKQQAAADATALTVARSITTGTTQSALQTIANTEAARNGFTNGSGGVTVTVTYPPSSGSYSSNSNAATVTISRAQNRIFSILALSSDPTVSTRAVAVNFTNTSGSACLLALDTSASNAMDFNGNMTLGMSGCTLASNSTNTQGMRFNGNVNVTATQLYSAGGIRKNGNVTISTTKSDVTNGTALSDPYDDYDTPSFSGCDQNNYSINGNFGTQTISPGTFCNGLSVNGNGTLNLSAGTYIIDRGNFSINGNVTVSGTGVTIILTSSTGSSWPGLSINGNSTVQLSAPTSGTHAGMLFYKDRDSGNSGSISFNGNANTQLTGVIYAPSQAISFNGNFSSTASCTQVVSRTLSINGNVNFSASCSGTGVSSIPVGASGIKLAE